MFKEGYIQTEEHKRKIGLANKGKKISEKQKEILRLSHIGKKLSEETRKKIGLNNPNRGKLRSQEVKDKISKANFKHGKPKCNICGIQLKSCYAKTCKKHIPRNPETYKKMSKKVSGENNWRWIKDRTKLCRVSKQGERRTSIYFNWRKLVWSRDNWKCKINNQDCLGRIEAHHILGFTEYPELRYDINNGITLCHYHHPKSRVEENKLCRIFKSLIKD